MTTKQVCVHQGWDWRLPYIPWMRGEEGSAPLYDTVGAILDHA